jgi:hypothetical protein
MRDSDVSRISVIGAPADNQIGDAHPYSVSQMSLIIRDTL